MSLGIIVTAVVAIFAPAGLTASPAQAAPVVTNASAFALAVPGSLLAGSAQGQTELPAAQLAALLANKTLYSPTWDSIAATYGTATPASPSAADAALIADAETAFAPVATELGAAAIGSAGGEAAVIVVGGAIATAISARAEKALGIIHDGDVCGFAPGPFNAVNNVLATVTSTDCDKWELSQQLIASPNGDVGALANFAIGSQSCIQGTCGTIYAGPVPEAPPSSNYYDYCVSSTTPNAFLNTYSGYGSAVTMVTTSSPPTNLSNLWYGGAPWDSSPNMYSGCTSTVAGAASYGIVPAGNTHNADAVPYTGWESATGASLVTGGTPTRLDIPRSYRCVVTLASGATLTNTVPAGQEGNGSFSEPECPGVGPNDAPVRVQIFLTSPSSPTGEVSIYDQATTPSYQAWKTTYPECGNGTCLLDLRQNSVSCLFQQINCDGWISSPTRDTDYTCYYGTHPVDLSECFIYAPTFDPDNQSSGHAYGDPSTGQTLDEQTSPSKRDKAVRTCVDAYDAPVTSTLLSYGATLSISRAAWQTTCINAPIFVTGQDTPGATAHDSDAIAENPARMFLTYVTKGEKPRVRWYSSQPVCVQAKVDVLDCDEYPFQSSEQGFAGLHQLGDPSLKGVTGEGDNRLQGARLKSFYLRCFAETPVRDSPQRNFIVIADRTEPTTTGYCSES